MTAEIIIKLCRARGIPIKKFEKDCGFGNGYVNHMRKENSTPSATRMKLIADYFGITEEELLGRSPKHTGYWSIPIMGKVVAGIPIKALENRLGEYKMWPVAGHDPEEYFCLKIKGNSMSPEIRDGDVVIVHQQSTAETNDIVIALVNGDEGCCKKLKKQENGIMLLSINPAYESYSFFTQKEIDTTPVQIIGKVIRLERDL